MIGIISPCYRMKKYLPLFLEELPKQTLLGDFKVYLDLNDPDDEELNLVNTFEKNHPGILDVYIQRPVEPIGISMNRCIERAKDCEYLAIWNVDDLRTKDSLELQYKTLLDENVDIVCGSFIIVNSFGKTEGEYINHTKYDDKEYFISMLLGPFFMFKKKLINKAGYFDEQLKSGADFDLAIRLAYFGSVKCLNDNLGYYLNEGKGASTSGNLQPIERTVIELRYEIYHKIETRYVPEASRYDFQNIHLKGKKLPVSDIIKNRERF